MPCCIASLIPPVVMPQVTEVDGVPMQAPITLAALMKRCINGTSLKLKDNEIHFRSDNVLSIMIYFVTLCVI